MAAGPAGAASARPRSRVGDKRTPPVPRRGSVPFQPVPKSKHPFFLFLTPLAEGFRASLAQPAACASLPASPPRCRTPMGTGLGQQMLQPCLSLPGEGAKPPLPPTVTSHAGGMGGRSSRGVNATQPRLWEPGGVLVQTRLTRTFPPAATCPRHPAVVAVPQPGRAAAAGGTAASLAPGGPCNGLCETTQLNCHPGGTCKGNERNPPCNVVFRGRANNPLLSQRRH